MSQTTNAVSRTNNNKQNQSAIAIVPENIYRLIEVSQSQIDGNQTQFTATIFNNMESLKVCWAANYHELRIKEGDLVSPRWPATMAFENGALKIHHLAHLKRPEPMLNLFRTVPAEWVDDVDLINEGIDLVEKIPGNYRHLFNAIFWDGQRFKRYCTLPATIDGHHSEDNGNLRHSIEVAKDIWQLSQYREMEVDGLGVLVGLLHDAGKADSFYLNEDGEWKLNGFGNYLDHKLMVNEWITQAVVKFDLVLSKAYYWAIFHCLNSRPSDSSTTDTRPLFREARLLLTMDQLSELDW